MVFFFWHRILNAKGVNHCSRKRYYFIGGKNCPPSFPVPSSLFSGSRSCASLSVPGLSFSFPDGILLVSCVTALLFSAPVSIGLRLLLLLAWVAAHAASAPIGGNLSRVRPLLLAQLPLAGALLGSNEAVAPIPLGRGIHELVHVGGTLMSGRQAGCPAMFLPSLLTK